MVLLIYHLRLIAELIGWAIILIVIAGGITNLVLYKDEDSTGKD